VIDAAVVTLEVLLLVAMTFVVAQSLCVWSCVRRRGRGGDAEKRPTGSGHMPPVSILKPITGHEDGMRANLESFMHLDYPDYEVVLCVQDPEDPALPLLEDMKADHPERRCRIVIGDCSGGLNPKVSNLLPGYETAEHDLILLSDANVRVGPSYLSEAVSHMADPAVGLVHNLVRGTGGATLGASMDNGYLNTFLVGTISLFDRLGISCVVGKSMLFRKGDLEPLGGLREVQDYLAEDYAIATRLELAGLRTVVSPFLVDRVATETSIGSFVRRYRRWGTMRHSISGPAYLLEPLTNPNPFALTLASLAAATRGVFDPAFALAVAAVATKAMVDGATLRALALRPRLEDVLVGPLRDSLIFYAWAAGGVSRSVVWRGRRFHVGKDSRLRASGTPVGHAGAEEGEERRAARLTGPRSIPGLRRVARARHPATR
jgi:ceramide glucosyltransferase